MALLSDNINNRVIYVVSSETESAFKWFRASCNNARLMELMDLTRLVEYL